MRGLKGKRIATFLSAVILAVCFVAAGMSAGSVTVLAKDEQKATSLNYSINAEMIGSDKDSYTVQITIENNGPDWEGTVRLLSQMYYYTGSAYDTEISLPQGSRKQFITRVGKESSYYTYSSSRAGNLKVYLLDKKGKVVGDREFDQILSGDAQYVQLGILSDDFSSLTYMDLGGDTLYIDGNNYPVKLKDMTQADLKEGLKELDFLVIDQYNTDVLTDDEIQAISDWNYDGGVLMVGTGAYVDEVLSGLGDYLGVKCDMIYAPEKETGQNPDQDFNQNPDQQLKSAEELADKALAMADLRDVYNRYYSSYHSGGMGLEGSQGDGAIMILPFALSNLENWGQTVLYQYGYNDAQSYAGMLMLDAYNNASVRYDQNDYSDNTRYSTRMMKFWGNSGNSLNFALLKFIIFMYVIFVGPILYLILKFAKKKELYWVLVPVTTLCAIGLVFLAGRGFKMVNTSVFSVTLENAEGRGMDTTYLYCYDASHKEWDLKLADGYNFASGTSSDNYSYAYNDKEDESGYYFHMQKRGEELYFGIKPGNSFEDCFFIAQRDSVRDSNAGKIICNRILTSAATTTYSYGSSIFGQVTNETGEDFAYCMVIADGSLYVYGELRNGQTLDLDTANPIYKDMNSYSITNQYLYGCLDDDSKHWSNKQVGQLAALGVAAGSLYSKQTQNRVIVIGVTDSGEKVVDDKCYEVAYKCLYTME